ncbi:hypothetical protein AB4043_22795 [Terriglobus sp. YAF25]|uniref:hypothetical protein n=1 Tax=Terriglobus sp. YAF25 TaxID=3233080 RepID=UPI003F973470
MIAPTSGNVSEGLRMLLILFFAAIPKKIFDCAGGCLGVLRLNGARFAEQRGQLL